MSLPLLSVPTYQVGPVPFRVVPFKDAVESVIATSQAIAAEVKSLATVDTSPGVGVHFANAYTIALADSDESYAELLARPRSAVFTDGVPVAWVGRRLYPSRARDWERVYGPDMMEAVFGASGTEVLRHYLLGGSPETLDVLQSVIAERWPSAIVVGAESPPFRVLSAPELEAQDARIRDSGATIVWVGLGTPKQDWEVARLADSVPVVAMAVGAAFDFLAGVKPQAPLWMQKSGTEWAFRFASEPRRLAKRYLWGNPRFLVAAVREQGLRKGL